MSQDFSGGSRAAAGSLATDEIPPAPRGICNPHLWCYGVPFMYEIVQPRILCMGPGALQSLERILRQMDPERILIVTGPHVKKLASSSGSSVRWDRIRIGRKRSSIRLPNRMWPSSRNAPASSVEKRYDLIVGLGGGSPWTWPRERRLWPSMKKG